MSIQRPTVAVGAPLSSLATLIPLLMTVTSVGGVFNRHCLKLELATAEDMFLLEPAYLARERALVNFESDIMGL